MSIRTADVALNVPLRQAFTYAVPDDLRDAVVPGVLVSVPFGKRAVVGCVVAVRDAESAEGLKTIESVASPEYRIDEELLSLSEFVADYYVCSRGEVLSAMATTGFRDVRLATTATYRLSPEWRSAKLTARQTAVCEILEAHPDAAGSRSALADLAGCSAPVVAKLVDAGALVPVVEEEHAPYSGPLEAPHPLNPEQAAAFDAILACIEPAPKFGAFLLFGVTGSGKTEVYLQAMDRTLAAGRTAICLVPEISLTPQTVERFERRFGERVGVFHSQLTRRAKLQLYARIREGRVRVVIGARSAVFAPLPDLGLVVIDEEHDGSYKQGETPRYNARDTALVRAQRLGIPVVMGSATPSLESFSNALEGKYALLRLSARAAGIEMPPVKAIDLAKELSAGFASGQISPTLQKAIRDRLDRGEQSLLFLNRRGFSNFLFCPSCRWVAKCDEDDVAMTVHRRRGNPRAAGPEGELDLFAAQEQPKELVLRCHFCGKFEDHPQQCPKCGREELVTVGSGTQRIEEELVALFPEARVLRLDYDSVGGREAWLRAWDRMMRGDADIIVGTQMIAKGLHLEKVTLVGAVLADVGLFIPDFRAEERTFALLTQVAGRAGRASAGEALFQTWMPDHTAVRCAMRHDYEAFYRDEIKRRRSLGFPPAMRLAAITVGDEDRDKAMRAAKQLAWLLHQRRGADPDRRLLVNGPTSAPLARLAGRFRFRILVRGSSSLAIGRTIRAALDDPALDCPSSTRISVDVDPQDLM